MLNIISYILNLVQTMSVCILLDEYLQNNYPEMREKYKNVIVNQSYNAIYFYSKMQIIFNKYKPYINKIIKDYPVLTKIFSSTHANYNIYDIEFVMDGEIVHKTTRSKMIELNNNELEYKGEFDFIIYSEQGRTNINDNENSIVNRKIIKKSDINERDLNCEKSEVKFVLCEFSIGDKKFKVDFKNASNNYYVVDNVFDTNFLKYFLKKYYSEHVKDIDLNLVHDFKINIMDHNIDSVVSNKENIVRLSKESYELIKVE